MLINFILYRILLKKCPLKSRFSKGTNALESLEFKIGSEGVKLTRRVALGSGWALSPEEHLNRRLFTYPCHINNQALSTLFFYCYSRSQEIFIIKPQPLSCFRVIYILKARLEWSLFLFSSISWNFSMIFESWLKFFSI